MQPYPSVASMLVILSVVLVSASASAQQPAPSVPQQQGPVGHRQPKMSDLPPALAKKERSGASAQATGSGDNESTSGQGERDQGTTVQIPPVRA